MIEEDKNVFKEFGRFYFQCQHSGSIDDLKRNFRASAREVELEQKEDKLSVSDTRKNVDIPEEYALPEEVAQVVNILGTWYNRMKKGEIVNPKE